MTAHLIDLTFTVYGGSGAGHMVHLERIGVPCDAPAVTIQSFSNAELAEELTRRLTEEADYGET